MSEPLDLFSEDDDLLPSSPEGEESSASPGEDSRKDGIADHTEKDSPPLPSPVGEEQVRANAPPAAPPAELPRRESPVPVKRPPLFARGVDGGDTFYMRLFTNSVYVGIVLLVVIVVGGGWWVSQFLWALYKPPLDNLGLPFSSHPCTPHKIERYSEHQDLFFKRNDVMGHQIVGMNDVALLHLAPMVGKGVISEALRGAMRTSVSFPAAGTGARAFEFSRGVVVITRDPSKPAGVGEVRIQRKERLAFCSFLNAAGLLGAKGVYETQENGQVLGPIPEGVEVWVSPVKGKVSELILRHQPTSQETPQN